MNEDGNERITLQHLICSVLSQVERILIPIAHENPINYKTRRKLMIRICEIKAYLGRLIVVFRLHRKINRSARSISGFNDVMQKIIEDIEKYYRYKTKMIYNMLRYENKDRHIVEKNNITKTSIDRLFFLKWNIPDTCKIDRLGLNHYIFADYSKRYNTLIKFKRNNKILVQRFRICWPKHIPNHEKLILSVAKRVNNAFSEQQPLLYLHFLLNWTYLTGLYIYAADCLKMHCCDYKFRMRKRDKKILFHFNKLKSVFTLEVIKNNVYLYSTKILDTNSKFFNMEIDYLTNNFEDILYKMNDLVMKYLIGAYIIILEDLRYLPLHFYKFIKNVHSIDIYFWDELALSLYIDEKTSRLASTSSYILGFPKSQIDNYIDLDPYGLTVLKAVLCQRQYNLILELVISRPLLFPVSQYQLTPNKNRVIFQTSNLVDYAVITKDMNTLFCLDIFSISVSKIVSTHTHYPTKEITLNTYADALSFAVRKALVLQMCIELSKMGKVSHQSMYHINFNIKSLGITIIKLNKLTHLTIKIPLVQSCINKVYDFSMIFNRTPARFFKIIPSFLRDYALFHLLSIETLINSSRSNNAMSIYLINDFKFFIRQRGTSSQCVMLAIDYPKQIYFNTLYDSCWHNHSEMVLPKFKCKFLNSTIVQNYLLDIIQAASAGFRLYPFLKVCSSALLEVCQLFTQLTDDQWNIMILPKLYNFTLTYMNKYTIQINYSVMNQFIIGIPQLSQYTLFLIAFGHSKFGNDYTVTNEVKYYSNKRIKDFIFMKKTIEHVFEFYNQLEESGFYETKFSRTPLEIELRRKYPFGEVIVIMTEAVIRFDVDGRTKLAKQIASYFDEFCNNGQYFKCIQFLKYINKEKKIEVIESIIGQIISLVKENEL